MPRYWLPEFPGDKSLVPFPPALDVRHGWISAAACEIIRQLLHRVGTEISRGPQQPEYLENQLKAFIERRRTNPVMFNVAHVLSPSMLTALSAHFKDLNPKPLGGTPKELVAAGKKIYEEGVPSAEVPPCATCHGPDAKGADAFPRLAGQLHDYVYRKLTNWEKERGQDKAKPDNSAIMQPIAHNLTEAQIKAVAAYLSYLE
jgi:cytochrome c553